MSVLILRFSAASGAGRFFCGARNPDTGIVKCRVVITPAVVILFRDFSRFQLSDLLLPGTKALIQIGSVHTAINDHFARQDRMEEQQEWEPALLKKIEATIRETLTNCLQGLQITTPQPIAEKSELPAQPDPPDETEVNIEAFLDCF